MKIIGRQGMYGGFDTSMAGYAALQAGGYHALNGGASFAGPAGAAFSGPGGFVAPPALATPPSGLVSPVAFVGQRGMGAQSEPLRVTRTAGLGGLGYGALGGGMAAGGGFGALGAAPTDAQLGVTGGTGIPALDTLLYGTSHTGKIRAMQRARALAKLERQRRKTLRVEARQARKTARVEARQGRITTRVEARQGRLTTVAAAKAARVQSGKDFGTSAMDALVGGAGAALDFGQDVLGLGTGAGPAALVPPAPQDVTAPPIDAGALDGSTEVQDTETEEKPSMVPYVLGGVVLIGGAALLLSSGKKKGKKGKKDKGASRG